MVALKMNSSTAHVSTAIEYATATRALQGHAVTGDARYLGDKHE
jgi:hypothetical protein